MELVDGGDLQHNIEKLGTYAEADAAEVMFRLALTLGFLHNQGACLLPLCSVKNSCLYEEHVSISAFYEHLRHRNRAPRCET